MWAQPTCSNSWPERGLNLAGSVKGEEIRGYLNPGHPTSARVDVSGIFFFPERWSPVQVKAGAALSVDGEFTDDCQMRLEDAKGGVWRLRFVTNRRLEGTMKESSGGTAKLSLDVVPPRGCEGDGPWRRYDSVKWPVTFEYPSSWRLGEREDGIVIGCPDAEALAWGDFTIWMSLGEGREAIVTEDGRHATRVATFTNFGNDVWLEGDCEEPDHPSVSCNSVRKSLWRGIIVLQAVTGFRRYRAGEGGYVGMGDAVRYLFILPDDRWVIIDSTQAPPDLGDEMLSPGPVSFEGDNVTQRLVRSIRRK